MVFTLELIFVWSRCTAKVTGRNINIRTGESCGITSDGIPERDCIFIPDQNSPAVASLMGHQNILKVRYNAPNNCSYGRTNEKV